MKLFILSSGRTKEVYSYFLINDSVNYENIFYSDVDNSLREVINNALNNNEFLKSDFKLIDNTKLLLINKGYKSINIYSNTIEFFSSEIEFDQGIFYNLFQADKVKNNFLFQFTVSPAAYLDEQTRKVYSSEKDIDFFNNIIRKTINENNGSKEKNIVNCIHEKLTKNGAFNEVEFHEYFFVCKHKLSKELLISFGFTEKDWRALTGNKNID
jgi:hypothetical protein